MDGDRMPQGHDGWAKVSEPNNDGIVIIPPGAVEIPNLRLPDTPPEQLDDHLSVLADESHTRGLSSFLEYRIAPRGEGPPTHWHPGHDELFYVVTGKLGMLAGEARAVFGPRSFVFVP